jgi:hypothetical protein
MTPLIHVAALFAPFVAIGAPATISGFTAPQQSWASADGQIHLLRPAIAQPSHSQEPLGALMTKGWRLNWNGKTDTRGIVAIRLALPVKPTSGQGQTTEVLQVGWSDAPEALRTCLTFGLDSGTRKLLPPRTINGVSFTVIENGDVGMSQSINAVDLRSVAGGRCYAIERFSYSVSASDPDTKISLAQKQGASMLDASLSSLSLGRGRTLAIPRVATPPGTVAR